MARSKSRTFTDVELEFMHIIWASGEATPDDIQNALLKNERRISIGSIRNVLAIMMQKGYLTRRKKGKAFLYRAKIQKQLARKTMIQNLLVSAFDSSESLVVAALLDNRNIDEEELKKIKHLINGKNRE
ncbi:MAG: hypothetical protein HOC71_04425 [Candidatus Latescibacteria bacterium]|jgi:BlaI family transcriptional regulator, penicillinase repressor|nr:hypothetical protein [Candidatus Latescibacterota bacterium]